MSRRLLLGPAKSGKTYSLLDDFETSLKESKTPLEEDFFFLVPSAEHTERIIRLLMQRGIQGFFHGRVTTLSKMLSGYFALGDEGIATNVTRFLIVRELFEKDEWAYFKDVQKSSGFLNLILSFISELKESLIDAHYFREKMNELKNLEPVFSSKYEALAGIYEAYEEALAQQGLRDRQDNFHLYHTKLISGEIKPPRIKKIWMDGFFDFSEHQLAQVNDLANCTDEMTITLTSDEIRRPELFESLELTKMKLVEMGFVVEDLSQKKAVRRFQSKTLSFIERNIFLPTELTKKEKPTNDITVYEAVGVEGEIEMIARTIQHQHRKGDYRFSDFAILLRHIGEYENVITSVFKRYQIPYELHERERLKFAPMIHVIVTLLRIFKDGWLRSDVIGFLKSSYVRSLGDEQNSYEWVSELENQSIQKGIFRGRDYWMQPWNSKDSRGEDFDQQKTRCLKPLVELEERLREAPDFHAVKSLLIEAISKTFRIFEVIDSMSESVRRDAISYKRFLSLLDEIQVSFNVAKKDEGSEEIFTFDQVADRFFRLQELDLYSLHQRDKNRVQVYGISLARQKEYRVVFLAGLLEKKFPVQMKEDPVISDWERNLFNKSREDKILKERLPRQSLERYLFYLALTRSSEKLFLTYPKLNLEGKESLPSYYVQEVQNLFSGPIRKISQQLGRPFPELRDAVNVRELELGVLGELWNGAHRDAKQDPLILYLTNVLLGKRKSQEKFKKAFYEIENRITDESISNLNVFHADKTSATGLEEYAKCHFRYYAHRVLRLKDTEEDINVMRRGIILHDVLERCFKSGVQIPAC